MKLLRSFTRQPLLTGIYLFLFFAAMQSCSSVHYGQVQNLKAFARSAKILSSTPGELYHSISDYRQQLRLVESSTLFTADKIIPRLNQSVQMQQAFEQNTSDVNQACELFNCYADCLLGLLGSEKELEGHSADLSIRLSNALKCYNTAFNKPSPAAIGDFIAMVVNKIGSMHLKELQKKYMKEFINSGSVIINDVCDYFIINVNTALKNETSSLGVQFDNVMRNFYDNVEIYERKQNVNPYNYFRYYNPVYLNMKQTLAQLDTLREQTMVAMKKIKNTHEKLRIDLQTETKGEFIDEVKDLYYAMENIKRGYENLKTLRALK